VCHSQQPLLSSQHELHQPAGRRCSDGRGRPHRFRLRVSQTTRPLQGMGGGIAILAQSVASSLSITGSTFSNNGHDEHFRQPGPDGGGAIYINTTNGSVHTIGVFPLFPIISPSAHLGARMVEPIDINTGHVEHQQLDLHGKFRDRPRAPQGRCDLCGLWDCEHQLLPD